MSSSAPSPTVALVGRGRRRGRPRGRRARGLPSHFLLATEVRHPRATSKNAAIFPRLQSAGPAQALDLLLGTQGWAPFRPSRSRNASISTTPSSTRQHAGGPNWRAPSPRCPDAEQARGSPRWIASYVKHFVTPPENGLAEQERARRSPQPGANFSALEVAESRPPRDAGRAEHEDVQAYWYLVRQLRRRAAGRRGRFCSACVALRIGVARLSDGRSRSSVAAGGRRVCSWVLFLGQRPQ